MSNILNINEYHDLVKSMYDFDMDYVNHFHKGMREWISNQLIERDILENFDEFKKWLKGVVRTQIIKRSPIMIDELRISIHHKPTLGDRAYVVIAQSMWGIDRFYFQKL